MLRNADELPPASSVFSTVSPKQPPATKRRDWYPYYAGFNEAFAATVFQTHLRGVATVLDPWSGSGTTTAVGLKLGVKSVGVDINPVVTVIARARVTRRCPEAPFRLIAPKIVSLAQSLQLATHRRDPLATWIQPSAIQRIRAIQAATHRVLTHSPLRFPDTGDLALLADTLPSRICFFYCALFLAVRKVLTRFRTTNPTWLKSAPSFRHRIAPSWTTLTTKFLESVFYLEERLSFIPGKYRFEPPPFMTATATNLPFRAAEFDAVLTSPPYATRLDYVTSTLPELAVLGANRKYLRDLRRKTTGSPVLRHASATGNDLLVSNYAKHTLDYIASHSSKGSRSYYLPWMSQYLRDLQDSLFEIDRIVNRKGVICLVIQDSYFKTFHIDLQGIVSETLRYRERNLTCRHDYSAPNPRSHTAMPGSDCRPSIRHHKESLLVFGCHQ